MPKSSGDALTRSSSFERAWRWAIVALFLLDAVLFFVARPFHRAVFEGELGIIELPTFLILLPAVPIAIWGASRSRGVERTLFVLLALGCLFWAGEEVSWGQTFFHWATPAGWSKGNYQHEANLHNEKGAVGTILNVVPRFILLVLSILSVVLNIPALAGIRRLLDRYFPPPWGDRLKACWLPATLALAASLLNKLKPWTGYKGFGESQELFIAIMLLQFTVLSARALAAPRAVQTSG